MFIKKNKKGFTIVELIVVMAVIGILVLLAVPKFMGHTKEARFTKLIANSKQLETASERYYMDTQSWPRLSDEPYSAEDIEEFAQKIYDATGKEITLDKNGNYYDIDYVKLSKYINVPDDKEYYIIQNPVGNVYALDGLTETAKTRLSENPKEPPITVISQNFEYTGNYQTYTIPKTGIYKLEVWGASGGGNNNLGGKGGYAYGEIQLSKGDVLYIYTGSQGIALYGGWNGGGSAQKSHGFGGGGATDIRTISGNWNDLASLQSRIIVAGGGGGSDDGLQNAKGGHGGGLVGGDGTLGSDTGTGYAGKGATQTSGGASGDGLNKGSLGIGGNGSNSDSGGGGGGYYGGGGSSGNNAGGGGGSSCIGGLSNAGTTAGVNTGNGKAIITYIGE